MKKNNRFVKLVAKECGISDAKALRKLNDTREKYGISYSLFCKLELYKLPDEELEKRAIAIAERRAKIDLIMQAKNCTYAEANDYVKYIKKQFKMSLEEYIDRGLYTKNDYELALLVEKEREKDRNFGKNKWARKVANEAGITYKQALEDMKRAKKLFGITYFQYCNYKLFNMTETQMATAALRLQRKQADRDFLYERIYELCGKTKEQAREEIRLINAKQPFFIIGVNWYFNYGVYALDIVKDNFTIDRLIQKTIWKNQLANRIRKKLNLVEAGKLDYYEVKEEIEEYYELIDELISDGLRDIYFDIIKYSMPETETDLKLRHDVVLDMAVTKMLLRFEPDEYASFSFYGKDVLEKIEYISSSYRARIIRVLNPQHIKDIFNSKYTAYSMLSEYYDREMVLIDGEKSRDLFKDFCKRHSTFVKKNNYDALGRGVEKVDVTPDTDLDALFDDLTEGGKLIILEELISAGKEIKALNADSVNTVRVITYVNHYKVNVVDCFMKVGRAGSFIDNGGAGGILVHINKDTGVFDSTGIDERGLRYEKHPDHGYDFIGIQLPDWEQALERAKEIALKIKDARFIGWDFTYTDEGKWIVVEGNALTQFYGQQSTIGRGVKREFLEEIGFDEALMVYVDKEDRLADKEDEQGNYKFERGEEREFFEMEDKISPAIKRHYLEERGMAEMKYFPDLRNPKTINEKILWLALNFKHPDIATAADKTTAKDYIAKIIGREYTVPSYGVYENASDIDFDALPNSFVVKLNDGWGASSVKVITDKESENIDRLKAELTSWLYPWNNYYYRNLCVTDEKLEKPALIVEKLLKDRSNPGSQLNDYKIYCCNGVPKYALVVSERLTNKESRSFVDMDWNIIPTGRRGKRFSDNPPKPRNLDLMIELSKKLSEPFPFVRIDFYEIGKKVYVGELTFTPGMFMRFTTYEWDYKLGQLLDLSEYIDNQKD
ncbi:MAG: hypothetical protein IJS03_09130 [Eubacterium sp.]|nr:hypothetical protein [Eubacterium sp.]